jgi:hypothetical protein
MTIEIRRNINKIKGHSKVISLVITLALVLSLSLGITVPAMGAPVVVSLTETSFGTDTTDHYVNLPATVNEGDLLIVFFSNDGIATVTTPAGWTELASDKRGIAVRLSVYYKTAEGDDEGTTVNFVTSAAEQAAAQVYRITNWQITSPPEISVVATGISTTPDPAFLDPIGWDVEETLWIAVAGQDRGDQLGTTAYPASYIGGTSTLSAHSWQSCRTLSAHRVLTAASEDPGSFTIPISDEWVTFTIGVRPAIRDLTITSTEGGSVIEPGEGVFAYDEGTVVDLAATPDEGYRFNEWAGNVSTIADIYANATNITMNGDYTITANFVAIYDLTTASTEGGSVIEPGEEVFAYDEGTVVDLEVEAEEGYLFIEWVGDVGTVADVYDGSTTITMNGDYSIIANFEEIPLAQYDLTISGTTGGSVTTPGEGVFTYGEASVVGIAVEAGEGYGFAQWTGDISTVADVYAASTTITMNGDYSITANFEEVPLVQYDLTTSNTNGGSVTEPGEGIFNYDEETVVDLVATPDEGYQFDEWIGDVGTIADIEAAVTTITMNGDYSITANFVAAPSGGCFIATAAYGTSTAEQIDVLRDFRDVVLLESIPGSLFVSLYYQFSPPVADFIAGNQLLRNVVREFLIDPIVWVVEATGDMWQPQKDLG